MDWSEICDKYNLDIHYDTLRKASQTIFGGVFVSNYYKSKNISDKKMLSQVKNVLGEQFVLKKQLQQEKNSITKLKNGFVKSISIAEELAEIQKQEGFQIVVPEYCYSCINDDSQYEMIVHITDWHIGYVIHDCKGNKFNWEIANDRVDQLIKSVKKYVSLFHIKKIYVINTGDMIEQNYMRKNQSQFCEFNQSEQVNHAIKIIFRFLVALAKTCDVEYDSVYGNHDRSNGDLSANLDGDNADTIIREQIKTYVELASIKRIKVVDRLHTDKEIIKETDNGLLFKAKHGDKVIKDDKQQMKSDISMDEMFYTILFKGHEHNYRCISENKGRYVVTTGCLSGYNDFSCNFGCATTASQTIAITCGGSVELIKDIQLK